MTTVKRVVVRRKPAEREFGPCAQYRVAHYALGTWVLCKTDKGVVQEFPNRRRARQYIKNSEGRDTPSDWQIIHPDGNRETMDFKPGDIEGS